MYSGTRSKVVTPDGDTEEFEITAGVLQGDTLAPFIFVIVLDYVLRKAISGRESEFGFMLTPRRSSRNPEKVITDLVFADDIALTSGNVWSGAEAAVQSRERGQPRRATSEWEGDKGYDL